MEELKTLKNGKLKKCDDWLHNPIIYFISFLFCFFIYLLQAYIGKPNLDYIPINGTFQSYNVIRRFLDGQIPFKDFAVYLGSGHLILTSLFTLLLGNNYAASVYSYDFVSSLSVLLYCYGLSFALFRKNWVIPTSIALFFRLVMAYVMKDMMHGGNSARNIRAMIIPLSIFIYVFVSIYLEKHDKWSEKKMFYSHIIVFSVLAGLSIVWSNDYGIVSCVAFFILVPLFVLIRYRKITRLLFSLLIMIVGSGTTAFILSFLITRGHPFIWVSSNFGSANYQGWYYEDPAIRTFYYYDFELSPAVFMCIAAMLIYFVLLTISLLRNSSWDSIRKYGLCLFVLVSCFGVVQGYRLFNRIDSTYSLFLIETIILLCFFEIIRIFSFFLEKRDYKPSKAISNVSVCFGALFVCFGLVYSLTHLSRDNSSLKYYPELGGYLDTCSVDLDKSLDITNGRKVFSTYASALEVATDQYQPSGTDYIIHVLSDESRERYIEAFNKRDFDVVSTIRLDYSIYGEWMKCANWFFYREVYSQCHFVGNNFYADYWEFGSDPDSVLYGDFSLKTERLSDNQVVLWFDAGDESINGYADVKLNYETIIKDDSSTFLLSRTVVGVEDMYITGEVEKKWTLRPSNEEYIPITVVNGQGCLVFTAYPEDVTSLNINEASCDRIFLAEYMPVYVD